LDKCFFSFFSRINPRFTAGKRIGAWNRHATHGHKKTTIFTSIVLWFFHWGGCGNGVQVWDPREQFQLDDVSGVNTHCVKILFHSSVKVVYDGDRKLYSTS
jgi:hypothetical protein